jgi:hypothetical protein
VGPGSEQGDRCLAVQRRDGKRRQSVDRQRRRRLADGDKDRHALGLQAPRRKGDCGERLGVEPLRIVHQCEDGRRIGGVGQHAEQPGGDQKGVGVARRAQPERRAYRCGL